jgi:RNA polymerase sigma-70 factor (ECF subfamily)
MRVSMVGASVASTARVAGVATTFASVYRAHFEFVCHTLRRFGVSEASAEDVCQEVFVVVSRRLAEFEERSSIKTWLFGIARHLAYRHRRSIGRRIVTVGDYALETVTDTHARSAQEIVERREASHVLDRLLGTLDDKSRQVFILAELEERPMPQVAEEMNINLNTAYTRLRAARRGLARALAEHPVHGSEKRCAAGARVD